jgi:hypothetical protein
MCKPLSEFQVEQVGSRNAEVCITDGISGSMARWKACSAFLGSNKRMGLLHQRNAIPIVVLLGEFCLLFKTLPCGFVRLVRELITSSETERNRMDTFARSQRV